MSDKEIFLVSVLHPRGGTLFLTCVNYNIIE